MSDTVTPMGQGPAKPATTTEQVKDDNGFTNPNLHRRIYTSPDDTSTTYKLGIYGYDSYRVTETVVHDEESRTCVIP